MDVNIARKRAKECRELSNFFIEFSPAVREFNGDLGWEGGRFSSRFLKAIVKWFLIWRLERFVLIPDLLVRIEVLIAMKNLRHVSKHIGLIASFYNSREDLSEAADSYLYEVLDLKELDFLEVVSGKLRHWQGCLSIDYSEEFRIARERVEINGKFTIKKRQLSDEELKIKLAENKIKTLSLARQDFLEYWEKYFKTDFSRRRNEVVYDGLDNIFRYIFTQEKNKETIAKVLQLLSQFATWKHFPEVWLVKLAEKNANQ